MLNPTQLAGLNEDGTSPKSRIASADQAVNTFSQLINRYQKRSAINAKVQGAIDGNPPIDQALLDSEGLGWQTNTNWRLLEGDVNAAQNPYYLLFKDVPDYMTIEVDDPKYNGVDNQKYGRIISKEVTRLLDNWKGFDYNMQLGNSNRAKFGYGTQFFPDREDFRFSATPVGTVYVDDETTQEMDKLNFIFVYYEWSVTDLFNKIEEDGAEEAGWNVEAVKELLIDNLVASTGLVKYRKWEYWQNKLRDNDMWWYSMDPKVKTAWAYVREFDGKISRLLVSANQAEGSQNFLFKKLSESDNWGEIIHPFFAEIGNGHWNGVKGLGLKCFNARDAQNRLKNRLVDAAMVGAQIILQAQDEKALEALQITQHGPFSLMSKDLTIAETPMASTLDKPMAVSQMLEVDLRGNIGSQRGAMGDPNSVQPVSAQQVQAEASFSNQIQLGEQTFYLSQLDSLYEEVVNRIKKKPRVASKSYPLVDWEKMVKTFHDRCTKKGVPASCFENIISVKAYRSIGRGSMMLKQQATVTIYNILKSDPNTPQVVSIRALRDAIASFCGQEALNNLWPDDQQPSMTEDASKAQDENGIMLMGVLPIYSDDQNSFVHAMVHLQFWTQQYQAAVQGQMDPAAYLKYAQQATQHIQTTLQAIQGDKTKGSQVQQLYNTFSQLVSESKGISQRYQQQQQAAQAQQQADAAKQQQAIQTGQMLDPESQVKMARVHADAQIQAQSTQAEIQRKNAVAASNIQLKAAKTRQEVAVKDVTTAQDLRINHAKANQAKPKPAK
jgi:hypothetical protein